MAEWRNGRTGEQVIVLCVLCVSVIHKYGVVWMT